MSQPVSFQRKVHVPRRPAHLVSRPRLLHALHAIVEQQLVILSAPIGYGKTALLIDFATSQPMLPVCWYALSCFDQDPWEFLTYLTTAIEQQFPHGVERTRSLLHGRSSATFDTVCAALAREIDGIGDTFVVVLDDWHLVDQVPEIRHVINTLLSHCANCHLMLATRTYPNLDNMMLLMARRQMSGIGEHDLRFTVDEACGVLQVQGSGASVDQIATKLERAHGWITGFLLLTQIPAQMPAPGPSEGHHIDRYIYNLLVEQVFSQQPEHVRAFLLDSALLEELNAQQCDAMLERTDSAQLLQLLIQRNVFLSEVGPGTYRYHTMFREFLWLHYRLSEQGRFQARAAACAKHYMAQQEWSQAFDTCAVAGDMPLAAQVMQISGEHMYAVSRMETLERWFATVPSDLLDAPLLCLKARLLLDRSKPHDARSSLMLAEARMRPEHRVQVLTESAQIARVAGNYAHALDDIEQALACDPSDVQRAALLRIQATCHHRLGQTEQAIGELNAALVIERTLHNLPAMARIYHDLGICAESKGRLYEAEEHYNHSDALLATIGNIGQRAMSLNSKAVVQHLCGRYHEAQVTLHTALGFAKDALLLRARATVLASLGDIYTDMQRWTDARAAYEDSYASGGSSFLKSYVQMMQVRLLIRQEQYAQAAQALAQLDPIIIQQQVHQERLLSASIALGLDQVDEAMALVEHAIGNVLRADTPTDLARAYLLRAQIAGVATPARRDLVEHWIEQALLLADSIRHDAFLVAEARTMPRLRQYGHPKGSRAAMWLYSVQPPAESIAAAPPAAAPSPALRPTLAVRTLGTDQILVNGMPVDIGWLKAREVLFYLLAHPAGATSDTLCDAIWADANIDKARDALRSSIYRLRSALPQGFIARQGRHTYRIDTALVDLSYDVADFLAVAEQDQPDDQALAEAIGLYRGMYLSWSENLWCGATRTYLEQCYVHMLRTLAAHYQAAQEHQKALPLYRRILAVSEFDEAAHASVMRCQLMLENRAAAIEQYQALQRLLDGELGLEVSPSSEAAQLYRQLLMS